MIYTGTSGLVLPVPNKQAFPPEFQDKSRLTYYASRFNSIEINSSFYKVPMVSTVKKWAESVPDNFQFTFKLWRQITHNKQLAFEAADVEHFMNVINNTGDKSGCLLIQFPKSITIASATQLEKLLSSIQAANPQHQWKVAVEFRSPTWYQQGVYDLLAYYQAGIVLHDMPASITPLIHVNQTFVYLRFHGPNGSYKGSYNDDFLHEYALYIKEWQDEGKTVYVYFNNTVGDAVKNLITLKQFING